VPAESLETVVRILGALVGVLTFAAALVGAYLAGRRGTSRLFERVGALEQRCETIEQRCRAIDNKARSDVEYFRGRVDEVRHLHKDNIPDLWKNRDDHERRIAELEKCWAVAECGKDGS